MNTPQRRDSDRAFAFRLISLEGAGLAALASLFAYFLALSWRRWPDPLIDFGSELYLPWRLSQGAVLDLDLDNVYGPLSQYFNASIFTCLGPGMMHLALANIAIFAGILTMTYLLFRQAWGAGAALVSLALFIALFGFSQWGNHGNYNYVTPYSQETTHGLFVCVTLVVVLVRWVENRTRAGSFLAGLLLGCTLVIKPEFVLASAVVIGGAMLIRIRHGAPPNLRDLGLMACGAALPTLAFVGLFATAMPWGDAVTAACRGWINAMTTTRYSGYPMQLNFLGLDRPAHNFRLELQATFYAGLLVALITIGAHLAGRISRRWLYLLGVGLGAAALAWIATREIEWIESGLCLPGLMLIYTIVCATALFRADGNIRQAQVIRFLLALLATTMLARMFLHARIYQYGFYQAALAAIMVSAILLGELPLRISAGREAAAITTGVLALLLPGVILLCAWSGEMLRCNTVAVGTGADLFYTPSYDRTGELVNAVSAALRKGPRDQTLLVLPEGVMINYLARLPSPLGHLCYFSMVTSGGHETQIVDELNQHPPDVVVIISRNLIEYGIMRYGSESGEGRELIAWATKNYEVEAATGGNPVDCFQLGAVVLVPKAGSP